MEVKLQKVVVVETVEQIPELKWNTVGFKNSLIIGKRQCYKTTLAKHLASLHGCPVKTIEDNVDDISQIDENQKQVVIIEDKVTYNIDLWTSAAFHKLLRCPNLMFIVIIQYPYRFIPQTCLDAFEYMYLNNYYYDDDMKHLHKIYGTKYDPYEDYKTVMSAILTSKCIACTDLDSGEIYFIDLSNLPTSAT
jgi:hypothetical protein